MNVSSLLGRQCGRWNVPSLGGVRLTTVIPILDSVFPAAARCKITGSICLSIAWYTRLVMSCGVFSILGSLLSPVSSWWEGGRSFFPDMLAVWWWLGYRSCVRRMDCVMQCSLMPVERHYIFSQIALVHSSGTLYGSTI